MTQQPSRKQFFAKLLGAAAAASVFPKLFAKSAPEVLSSAPAAAPAGQASRFQVRVDGRAVARGAQTL